jgi:ATP synthase protein I
MRAVRVALYWQLGATAIAAVIAGVAAGRNGVLSALLGGLVNVTAGALFGWVATHARNKTAGETLRAALRAEAAKIGLIVIQLWAVLTIYKHVVLAAFFGSFILTVILFSMALLARER